MYKYCINVYITVEIGVIITYVTALIEACIHLTQMHTATDETLPGLKYKKIGLGLINNFGEYLTKKASNFDENRLNNITRDIEQTDNSTLPEAVSKKLAKVKRIGAGRRRIKRRRKKKKNYYKKNS